jgi:2-polyprenyl-6-methoxyphenol hydroxylase-like FAD-dependent oxidoreductase
MSLKRETEVLVVGAGPVGMFTALLLARGGIETQIIDQESRTAGHSYSCALHPRTIKLLNEAGIASTLFRSSRRIDSVGYYQGASRRAEVQLSRLFVPFPFALALPQSNLEDLLEAELRRAGVEISWHHRLNALENHQHGARASVDRLAHTGHGYIVPEFELTVQDSVEVDARFMVGADGQHSMVRQRLDTPFETAGAPQFFVVFEGEAAKDSGHEVKVVLDDATDSVMWPLSDTRFRWSFQVAPATTPDEFPTKERQRMVVIEQAGEEDSLHRLQKLLSERAPWFDNPVQQVVWNAQVQFEPRLARQFGKDLCWLVGDAAHQTGPIGMQSMNIGFREAAHLAEALKHILRDGKALDLVQRYGHENWYQWKRLFGSAGGARPTTAASDWVRQRAPRILSSIPASGEELVELLNRLGIMFK